MKYSKFLLILVVLFMFTSCTNKKYDLSGVAFEDETVHYDGKEHMIYVTGDIPEGVEVEYNLNCAIHEGVYEIVARFIVDQNIIEEKTATLTILPAERLNIYLRDKTVAYDGNEHAIDPEGDLPDDLIILYQSKYIDAGEYTVTCTIYSESVYIPEEQRTLEATLTIEKAVFDTSSIVFSETEFIYDDRLHSISVVSDLPTGVEVFFENNGKSLIGTYDVIVNFIVGQNYEQPSPLHLQLKIVRPSDLYIVTFIDGDKTIDVYVKEGLKYDFPEPTSVKGYIVKWDKDLTNITSDMVVNKQLTPINHVLSVDWGEATPYDLPKYINIETDEIPLPNPRTPENVIFEGWYTSPDFSEETRVDRVSAGVGGNGDYFLYAKTVGYRIEAAAGFELNKNGIYYKKIYQENDQYYVGNFEVSKNAKYEVFTDSNCETKISDYQLHLEQGSNKFYVKVTNSNYFQVYSFNIEWIKGLEVYLHKLEDQVDVIIYEPNTPIYDFGDYSVWGYTFNGWLDEKGEKVTYYYATFGYIHLYADITWYTVCEVTSYAN